MPLTICIARSRGIQVWRDRAKLTTCRGSQPLCCPRPNGHIPARITVAVGTAPDFPSRRKINPGRLAPRPGAPFCWSAVTRLLLPLVLGRACTHS